MYKDREVAQREALVKGRAKIEEQMADREAERKAAHARLLEEQAAFKAEAKLKEEVRPTGRGCVCRVCVLCVRAIVRARVRVCLAYRRLRLHARVRGRRGQGRSRSWGSVLFHECVRV
jgi:hypothetical protein